LGEGMAVLNLARRYCRVFVIEVSEPLTRAVEAVERRDLPAIGVAVIEPDRAHIAVTGLREIGSDAAATPGDQWHIGSNTKAMTALLALKLAEEGVLDLNDPLTAHLPAAAKGKAVYRDKTLRDLLSHRARIPPNLGILGMLQMAGSDDSRDQQADRARLASWMLARASQSEGFTYSNVGYAIAGSMIENAAGVAFETLMVDQIAEPLGLCDFGFGPPQDNTEAPDAPNQPGGHTGA
jgi:D-alanyl-D-alanine carboxypeptidase